MGRSYRFQMHVWTVRSARVPRRLSWLGAFGMFVSVRLDTGHVSPRPMYSQSAPQTWVSKPFTKIPWRTCVHSFAPLAPLAIAELKL